MIIGYSRQFLKQLKKAPIQIIESFQTRLSLFSQSQSHPLLNNHILTGEWKGCRSINMTGDWRAIFEEKESGSLVYFVAIGTHSQLYR